MPRLLGRVDLGDLGSLPLREPMLDADAAPPLACVSWGWMSLGRPKDTLLPVRAVLIEAMHPGA